MATVHAFEQHVRERFAHRDASLAAFVSRQHLHCRLARRRTGAAAGWAPPNARLRVLRVIATRRGHCISDIARELDLTHQRIPRLLAACRVAVQCGVRREREWFENLGESAGTSQLRRLDALAPCCRRHLPWRSADPDALRMPRRQPPGAWRLALSPWRREPAPGGSGCAARATASR